MHIYSYTLQILVTLCPMGPIVTIVYILLLSLYKMIASVLHNGNIQDWLFILDNILSVMENARPHISTVLNFSYGQNCLVLFITPNLHTKLTK